MSALGQHRKSTLKELNFATAHELAGAIRERRVSAVEVLDAQLARIARYNPALNAIVTLNEENARVRAREADAALARRAGDYQRLFRDSRFADNQRLPTAGQLYT